MAKTNTPPPSSGKGSSIHHHPVKERKTKITPIEIAFLVERYLADNRYSTALSAFRSEAADLFSKTKGKSAPKGLLGLAEILDEYITLKEQKLIVAQEKRRIDALLLTIHDAVKVYHGPPPIAPPASTIPISSTSAPPATTIRISSTSAPPATVSSPLSSPSAATLLSSNRHQTPTLIHDNAAGSAPSAGNMARSFRPVRPALPSVPCDKSNFSTPVADSSSKRKRKTMKQLPQPPPAPKKCRPAAGVVTLPSQVCVDGGFSILPGQTSPLNTNPSSHEASSSSIAKSLFELPGDSHLNLSSPKTPPQDSPSLPPDPSRPVMPNASQDNVVSTCSVISSKKIVVISPFKQSGYYSVKTTSHHVTTSPLKCSSPSKSSSSKRDHVKSRLDFDSEVSEKFIEVQAETASPNEEKPQEMDDLFDLGFFDLQPDFSFSDLFVDLDVGDSDMNLLSEPELSPSCETDVTIPE